MGARISQEYVTAEDEFPAQSVPVSETSTPGIKHNGLSGLEVVELQSVHVGTTEPAAIMGNNLLTQTEEGAPKAMVESHELDSFLGKTFEEKPLWKDLYESVRDVFFPPKLPPLVLTSTPIPVPDRMAVKRNPWAVGISSTVNLLILAIVLYIGVRKIVDVVTPPTTVTPVQLTDYRGPKAPSAAGGGGGSPDKTEAIKGKIPPRATPLNLQPRIIQPPVPTIDVQKDIVIPDNPTLPNFGMSNSSNVKLASGGNGSGMGMGSGSGDGYGPGFGGNIGGGLFHIGGGVSAPELIHKVDAEFSDEARRAKYQGVCLVSLVVDAQGNPQQVRVVRSLGMGLDEKAIEAVKQFKFKPAMKDGKQAVAVPITIEVNFRLY